MEREWMKILCSDYMHHDLTIIERKQIYLIILISKSYPLIKVL